MTAAFKKPIPKAKPTVKKKKKSATSSFATLQKIKAAGLTEFRQAKRTRSAYAGYVDRGRKFLLDIVRDRRENGDEGVGKDGIDTDLLAKAFETPNKYSVTALELYLVQKCFTEGFGKSTSDGIHGAFSYLWDHM